MQTEPEFLEEIKLKTLKDLNPLVWVNGDARNAIRTIALDWRLSHSEEQNPDCDVCAFIEEFFNLTEEEIQSGKTTD